MVSTFFLELELPFTPVAAAGQFHLSGLPLNPATTAEYAIKYIHIRQTGYTRHALLKQSTDYYPFGSPMPGRNFMGMEYRYGFNGMEKDNEVKGTGNSYTAEFWQYDSRLGRRWNLDPIFFPWLSGYSTFDNNPIYFTDPQGLSPKPGRNIFQRIFGRTSSGIKHGPKIKRKEVEMKPPQGKFKLPIIKIDKDPRAKTENDEAEFSDVEINESFKFNLSYNPRITAAKFELNRFSEDDISLSLSRNGAILPNLSKTIFEFSEKDLKTDFLKVRRPLQPLDKQNFTVNYIHLLKADPSIINRQHHKFDNLSIYFENNVAGFNLERNFKLIYKIRLSEDEIKAKEKQGFEFKY
jgi:RHS repeat-associated protein